MHAHSKMHKCVSKNACRQKVVAMFISHAVCSEGRLGRSQKWGGEGGVEETVTPPHHVNTHMRKAQNVHVLFLILSVLVCFSFSRGMVAWEGEGWEEVLVLFTGAGMDGVGKLHLLELWALPFCR